MKNSHQKDCVKAYTDSLQYYNCAAPVDATIETVGPGPSARYVTDSDKFNRKFREAGEKIADALGYAMGVSNLFNTGQMPGMMGNVFAQAWADAKQGVADFFGSIGSAIDDIASAFGRFRISDYYTENYYIRSQISSWKPNQTWGSNSGGAKFAELPGGAEATYYSSPLYGNYLTPFDESIENLLGSEDFQSTSSQLVNELNQLYNFCNDIVNEIDNLDVNISSNDIERLTQDYNRLNGDYQNVDQGIVPDSQVTMNEAFDMIAKRWIAKGHNTVNHIRAYYRSENKKWYIKYSPQSKEIVKKYFPNINNNKFANTEYKFIDMETL